MSRMREIGPSETSLTVACFPSSSLSPPGLCTSQSLLTKKRRMERPGRPSTSGSTLTPRRLGACVTKSFSAFGSWRAGTPIDFFTKGMDLKIRLQGLGEEVSNDVYLDIMLLGLTKDYREEFSSVNRIQETTNRFYVDQPPRNESGPVVSGRGAAVSGSSSVQCHRCKAYGHFQRDCPQQVQKNRLKPGKKKWKNKHGGGGASAQPKWCSYHKTTTHRDAKGQKQ